MVGAMTQGDLFPTDAPSSPETGGESPRRGFFDDVCACGCGLLVPMQKRGGEPKRYFSDDHQRRHYNETHPRIATPPPRKGGRTRAQRILARLREGPATGLDLLRAGGGTRYGARVLELRRMGHRIELDRSGEWPVYRLVEE